MKKAGAFLVVLLAVRLAAAATPEVEVETRFVELADGASSPADGAWPCATDAVWTGVATNITNALTALAPGGAVDVLSAPKVRTRSGTKATIKVVREYSCATDVEIRPMAITNGSAITKGVAVVPCRFETREVGISLQVTPLWAASRKQIDLDLLAEVVELVMWKDYPVTYQGADGKRQKATLSQPIFDTRRVAPKLSLRNNETVVAGGIATTSHRLVEDRIPFLGDIPWLGRLFRSTREVQEKKKLLIVVTARLVGESP